MKVFLEPCPLAEKKIDEYAILEVRKFNLSNSNNIGVKECDCCGKTRKEVALYETGVYKLPTYIGIQGNVLCEDCINFIYDFYFNEPKKKKRIITKNRRSNNKSEKRI